MTKAKQAIRDEAIAELHKLLKPGATVYTILRHVSASGMSRRISTLVKDPDLGMREISHLVARALDYRRNDRDGGLIVSGCGMDMGFEVVYQLGSKLWPNGTPKPHGTRNGEPDSNGGYALKQRWL